MRDTRTDAQKRRVLVSSRASRTGEAITLVMALHDAGFSRVWCESTQISGDGYYLARVIVDEVEINGERMAVIQSVAEKWDAKVMLTEVRMNQQSFSRIALWPASPKGEN